MATFSKGRRIYTSEGIRKKRKERLSKKPLVNGVPTVSYVQSIGDLIGAGHMRLCGPHKINVEKDVSAAYVPPDSHRLIYKIEMQSYEFEGGRGEAPHMSGYLTSGHPNDPTFRLKGWFNVDGTIRLELVKEFDAASIKQII
jgi:hypothetical protein